jgi:sigma-B regulation protein RsbU (phosphoserine phosphatase)
MPHFRSLALRLVVWTAATTILIYVVALYNDYRISREHIIDKSRIEATQIVSSAVGDLTAMLQGVQRSTDLFAQVLSATPMTLAQTDALLRDIVAGRDDLYGATVALEPAPGSPHGFAPYYYHAGGTVRYADLAAAEYGYLAQDWYVEPRLRARPVWSEPYFDEGGGNALMATYSVPLERMRSGSAEFIGVVTADITLDRLQSYLNRIRLGESGFAFLMSGEGRLLSYPDRSVLMRQFVEVNPQLANDAAWRDAYDRTLRGETGVVRLRCQTGSGACLYAFSPLADTGWRIAVLYPEHELLAPLREYSSKVAIIAATGTVLLLLAVTLLARTITRPLVALAAASERLGGGDLEVEMPAVRGRDEVALLVSAFRRMQARLKQFIAQIEQEAATRNRLQGELDAAHQIQMEMLPHAGRADVRRTAYDLWARLIPAKSVGGDFYTWLEIDRGRLLLVVGDVSDKGVPAALFMARAITLLQQFAAAGASPNVILRRLNASLAENNEACMFATLWCGILDIASGRLDFASGGHTAPLLLCGKRAAPVPQEHGSALGVVTPAEFPLNSVQLQAGDMIALYTDGIDEAMNPQREQFGHERLAAALQESGPHDTRTAGEHVLATVKSFVAGAPQSDDITLLMIAYHGASKLLVDMPSHSYASCEFAVQLAALDDLHAWLAGWLRDQRLTDAELLHDLRLVAEEIFVNIVNYGGLDSGERIIARLAHDGARVALEMMDRGRPWNPLEQAPVPTLGQSIDDARIGGLGVFLVGELTDRQLYRRDDGANRFCVLKTLHRSTEGKPT